RPDQILAREDLEDWFVVEIELASHPARHFLDPFRVLSSASYGMGLLPTVLRSLPDLTGAEAAGILSHSTGFLCIADDDTDALRSACRDFGFEFAVMQPYRSEMGSYGLLRHRVPRALDPPSRRAGVYRLTYSTHLGGHLVAS